MTRLKVLEWNINQRTSGIRMPDYVPSEILSRDPDVIVLVEFKGEENLATLKSSFSDRYYIASYDGVIELAKNSKKGKTGNGVFIALKKDKFKQPTMENIHYQRALAANSQRYDEPNWLKIFATLRNGQPLNIIGTRTRVSGESKSDFKSRKAQINWICDKNRNETPLLMIGDLNYGPHRTEWLGSVRLNWQDVIEGIRNNGCLKTPKGSKHTTVTFLGKSPYSPYAPNGNSFKNEKLDWLIAKNIIIDMDSDYNAFSWQFGRHNTQKFVPGYLTSDNYFIRTDPSYPDHAIFTVMVDIPE